HAPPLSRPVVGPWGRRPLPPPSPPGRPCMRDRFQPRVPGDGVSLQPHLAPAPPPRRPLSRSQARWAGWLALLGRCPLDPSPVQSSPAVGPVCWPHVLALALVHAPLAAVRAAGLGFACCILLHLGSAT